MIHIDTGLVVAVLTIATALLAISRWLYHQFKSLDDLLSDWRGEPERPGVPHRPGVLERLDNIERKVNSAAFNSQSNHGTSAYDAHTEMLLEILEEIKKGNDDA